MVGKKAVLMLVLLSLGMVAGTLQPAQSVKTARIDFEGLAEGNIVSSLSHGAGISGDPIEGDVTVFGSNPNFPGNPPDEPPNTAMIFDANCEGGCSGEDYDLDFSSDNLGNVLIISEDLDSSDPDDAAGPGDFYFEFDFTKFGNGTVNLKSLTYGDIDEYEDPGLIKVYKGSQLKKEVDLPRTGNNEKRERLVEANDIDRLRVEFFGSMMIDNIEIEIENGDGYIYYLPMANNDLDLFNVTIGYEDRASDDEERLDYDYNDWAVSIWTKFEGDFVDEDTIELEKIIFKMEPKARGGKIGHKFYLRIDANTFSSDGDYELVIKGEPEPGGSLPENVGDNFEKSEEIDVLVNFLDTGCDCEAFGKHEDNGQEKKWNVYEDRPDLKRKAQRWAELSITFNTPFEFDFPAPDYEEHCKDLFFDPYLKVKYDDEPTEKEISWKAKDSPPTEYRILCVNDPDWQWPEEGVHIWDAYDSVTFTDDEPPRPFFSPNWFTRDKATDCVFDGRPCTKK